jgi:hypothetical protein
VKKAFQRAGLSEKDPARYGAHSLRAGFATAAYHSGASELAIMRQTGHKSNVMVRRYIRAEKTDRLAAISINPRSDSGQTKVSRPGDLLRDSRSLGHISGVIGVAEAFELPGSQIETWRIRRFLPVRKKR